MATTFEAWNGTAEEGKVVVDQAVSVRASQATKRDASGVREAIYSTYEEERESVATTLARLMTEIREYDPHGNGMYKKLHARIRADSEREGRDGREEWFQARKKLDEEREALKKRISWLQLRLREIKPFVQKEKAEKHAREQAKRDEKFGGAAGGRIDLGPVIIQMREEIRELRRILEERLPEPIVRT